MNDVNWEGSLVRYDAARRALAEAARVDEVKQIRDMAVAAQVYARQAQDVELINNATEIRKRAERRVGEILAEMKAKGERSKPGDAGGGTDGVGVRPSVNPTLKDIGVTKTQSARWQQLAAMPADKFEQHVATSKKQAAASLDRTASTEDKKAKRAEREQELAERTAAAAKTLNRKIYGVILADPWRWEPYSRETGMDRSADNHYQTMDLTAIKALKVPAADDCALFLWATIPMLPQALEVMAAWGFTYKSQFVWVKDKIGPGYWAREQHELLLIGTRGNIPAPAPGEQYLSVISAPRARHSEKPPVVYDMIEGRAWRCSRVGCFRQRGWRTFDKGGRTGGVPCNHGSASAASEVAAARTRGRDTK
jgi:N6-adenosine-specific RNA methylase IME4